MPSLLEPIATRVEAIACRLEATTTSSKDAIRVGGYLRL